MGRWEFWAIAMVMSVVACAILIVPALWFQRAQSDASFHRRRILAIIGAVAALPLAAMVLYGILGSPTVPSTHGARVPVSHPALDSSASAQQGGDLGEAVTRLETKLRADSSNAEDWRLLSQSYAFMGRAADAARAQEMAERAEKGAAVDPAVLGPTATREDFAHLEARLSKDARDADALILLAEGHRRKREFPQALAAFSRLVELKAMSADLWADYADALAADHGGLDAESAALINKALKLDARHPKALWLLGSWQTRTRDHRSALATWERLSSVLPPTSPDAGIIAANIQEARNELGMSDASRAAPATAAPRASVSLSGEVEVDPKLRARIPRGSMLLVFAKAVSSPGPPLAVVRYEVGSWPTRFKLDDAAAMLPGRTLSGFEDVIVEARISRSGSATAARGDLRGVSGVLNPRASGPLRLVISEEIG